MGQTRRLGDFVGWPSPHRHQHIVGRFKTGGLHGCDRDPRALHLAAASRVPQAAPWSYPPAIVRTSLSIGWSTARAIGLWLVVASCTRSQAPTPAAVATSSDPALYAAPRPPSPGSTRPTDDGRNARQSLADGGAPHSSDPSASRRVGQPVAPGARSATPPGVDGGRCPEGMSYLPEATVVLGSNDIQDKKYWIHAAYDEVFWGSLPEPVHSAHLGPLCMDTTEVTVAAYRACMSRGGCTPPHASDSYVQCYWSKPRSDNIPIDCVTWSQADAYCRFLEKRLPTEEEWEYGARGTDQRRYPWGNEDPRNSELKWVQFCTRGGSLPPCPVDQFREYASPFGLLGMVGNVAEWTYSDDCTEDGGCRKVVRGTGGTHLGAMRSAHRESARRDAWDDQLGFRCIQSLSRLDTGRTSP